MTTEEQDELYGAMYRETINKSKVPKVDKTYNAIKWTAIIFCLSVVLPILKIIPWEIAGLVAIGSIIVMVLLLIALSLADREE